MLHQMLSVIQAGEAHALQEIAQSMNISADMALQMIKELTDKGYLQEISSDCDQQQNACKECPTKMDCHSILRQWLLTEKGKAAVSEAPKLKR
jgi:hypothetical protein